MPVQCSNQLSCEAIDNGNWLFVVQTDFISYFVTFLATISSIMHTHRDLILVEVKNHLVKIKKIKIYL